jgi:hypothetical protein
MSAARAGVAGILLVSAIACSQGKPPVPAGGNAAASADPSRPLPNPLPDVVARVDGRAISIWQILPLAKTELDGVPETEREKRRPEVLRRALDTYVERELLLQEALSRGIQADARAVDWSYDQMRREHADESEWRSFLGMRGYASPQSFRAELRIRQTIDALVGQEVAGFPIPAEAIRAAYTADPSRFAPRGAASPPPFESVRGQVEAALRQAGRDAIVAGLLARLRARARIELLL